MDLRAIQKPLKEKYRSDPTSSLITLKALGNQNDSPISCSVEVGQKLIDAQAHAGVGGSDSPVLLISSRYNTCAFHHQDNCPLGGSRTMHCLFGNHETLTRLQFYGPSFEIDEKFP